MTTAMLLRSLRSSSYTPLIAAVVLLRKRDT